MTHSRYSDRELSYRLHKLGFLLERTADPAITKATGLGFSQFKILMALNHNPEACGANIAEFLGLTEAAVSRQVNQLADRGFLKRELASDNRRQHTLTVTARGKAVTDKARLALSDSLVPVYRDMSDQQRDELGAVLDVLVLRAQDTCTVQNKQPKGSK